jgi:hypothetical protein
VVLAAAGPEVWTGWVGIAQKTGFGLVSPLPGIWPSLHLARLIASRLVAAGKPVSRRALRSRGIRGSNAALNALACEINAELAGTDRAASGLDGADVA